MTDKALEILEFVANKFEERPWTYTTNTKDLKHIRYKQDYTGYNVWYRRLGRAFNLRDWFSWGPLDEVIFVSWWKKIHPLSIWAHILVNLRKESNLPDGVVKGAGVITPWSENGIFISMMNPDVANVILDFIYDRPEDKYAVALREEFERAYVRLKESE